MYATLGPEHEGICKSSLTALQALESKLAALPDDAHGAKSFHDASDKVKFKAQVDADAGTLPLH
jgi:hypothetical protein